MPDTIKEMTVKLGIEVDQDGLAKATAALQPLVALVESLHALEALGIRVRITMDEPSEGRAGFVAD